MKEHFFELAGRLTQELRAREVLLCTLSAERSDFVRFNRSRVRQAGSVEQRFFSLRLVRERRQMTVTLALAGDGADLDAARAALARSREAIDGLPEDPWLLIQEAPQSTHAERRGALAPAETVAERVVADARDCDLVGIYAAGTVYRGFANSFGQRNWHEADSFNFDWSLHLGTDRAVKAAYAGTEWEEATFAARLAAAREQLAFLAAPPHALAPGDYRAYFTPRALEEIAGMLGLGGFSARARITRQSPLLRLEHGEALSPKVTLTEHTADGMAPCFQDEGFVKPPAVALVTDGRLGDALVSPRSAREHGLATNAANAGESPESLDMAAGTLPAADALAALDTGLYIGNLWYLNYSDRPAGRITGMTRFATFWVAGGRIVAPARPLRFDDSVLRMLGANLVDLTRERELLLDPSTYDERSTRSARLPGALLRSLRFTL